MKTMLLMISLPVADCSTFLPLQWGLLAREWCNRQECPQSARCRLPGRSV